LDDSAREFIPGYWPGSTIENAIREKFDSPLTKERERGRLLARGFNTSPDPSLVRRGTPP
jgi:hypothetical protein